MALLFASVGASAAERTWTRSEILAIADAEVKRLGYDAEQMSVSFDVYNSLWRNYQEMFVNTPPPELKGLAGREFFAVYYGPLKKRQKGGDLWIFIDQETGKVIDTLRGQ